MTTSWQLPREDGIEIWPLAALLTPSRPASPAREDALAGRDVSSVAHALQRADAGAHRGEPDREAGSGGDQESARHQGELRRCAGKASCALEEVYGRGPADQHD